MSDGHFKYRQYKLNDFAEEMAWLIENNDFDTIGEGYSPGTITASITASKTAVTLLAISRTLVHRVDWLVSGDDSEEKFQERLAEELYRAQEQFGEEWLVECGLL